MLSEYGLTVIDVEKISIHSGSIRVTAKKSNEEHNDKIVKIFTRRKKDYF